MHADTHFSGRVPSAFLAELSPPPRLGAASSSQPRYDLRDLASGVARVDENDEERESFNRAQYTAASLTP